MPQDQYGINLPGVAAAEGLEDFMLKRQLAQRQQMLDSLAQQKEATAEKRADQTAKFQEEAVSARMEKAKTEAADKGRADVEKRIVNGYLPGDTLPPELIKDMKTYGVLESYAKQDETGTWKYQGTAKERETNIKQKQIDDAFGALKQLKPDDPNYRAAALHYAHLTGDNALETKLLEPPKPGGDTEPLYRTNAAKGIVEHLQGGQWVPVTGDVPKGHFMPEPPDKSAVEGARVQAEKDKAENRRNLTYHQTLEDINKLEKPVSERLDKLDNAASILSQHGVVADNQVNLALTSALAVGTGMRISNAILSKAAGDNWQQLLDKYGRWAGGEASFALSDPEKSQMKALVKAIQKEMLKKQEAITKAKREMLTDETPRELQKTQERLDEALGELHSGGEASEPDSSAPAFKSIPGAYVREKK